MKKKVSAAPRGGGGGGRGRGGRGRGGARKDEKFSEDSFFMAESKKRRKISDDADVIDSGESDDERGYGFRGGSDGEDDDGGDVETADEVRQRVAMAQLDKYRRIAKEEEDEEDEDNSDEGIDRVGEKEGLRDSLVAKILQQEQLEESGRVRRAMASRVQKPKATGGFKVLLKHRQSVTAVALSEDDSRGFSASKDGNILHWDVESGKREKYQWPSDDVIRSHGAKDPQGSAKKHSRNVLALAVSSDGRYLATGGLDRHVHLWDTRTRDHIQMRSMSTPNLTERPFDKRKTYMNLPVCNIIAHVGVGMARDRYYREVVAESPDRTHYHGFEDQFCGFHWPSNELNLDVFCTGPCNFHKNVEGYSTHVFECAHWLHGTSFLHIPNSNYSNIIHIHCFWNLELLKK